MATTADFRNGMTIELDGQYYTIIEFLHVKPGKGGAFVRTKLKNVKTDAVIDRTFRAGEKIQEVRLERRQMQFLYRTENIYYVMEIITYDQLGLSEELFKDVNKYLKENTEVTVLFCEDKPIGVELPYFVELKIKDTEPGVKGDTVSGGSKQAVLETGAVVQVPLFINIGDTIKIDTRTGEYLERV